MLPAGRKSGVSTKQTARDPTQCSHTTCLQAGLCLVAPLAQVVYVHAVSVCICSGDLRRPGVAEWRVELRSLSDTQNVPQAVSRTRGKWPVMTTRPLSHTTRNSFWGPGNRAYTSRTFSDTPKSSWLSQMLSNCPCNLQT